MNNRKLERLADLCFTTAWIFFILTILSFAASIYFAEPTAPEPIIIETEEQIISLQTMPEKEYLGTFTCTAYCSCDICCGPWADGIVYTGGYATEGKTIAVDPDIIPLGSVVEINSQRYIAEDIGGSIEGKEIDIFMVKHESALQWGVQQHEVYLVK